MLKNSYTRPNELQKECIDTLLGLGLWIWLGLWLEFTYVQTGDVCTYHHYLQATSDLQPIKWLDNRQMAVI